MTEHYAEIISAQNATFFRPNEKGTTKTSTINSQPQYLSTSLDTEEDCLMYGVSLAHLLTLPNANDTSFDKVCEFVLNQTSNMKSGIYRSYAQWLRHNPKAKHLVRDKATVFVSYAREGGFAKIMKALRGHFIHKLEETFVWMDFAILDLHSTPAKSLDFAQHAKQFRERLIQIGQGVLVLTPGTNPIAVSKSWCCFEWAMIVQSNIPFTCCFPMEDEQDLIRQMRNEMSCEGLFNIFAEINVKKARAQSDAEEQAIRNLIREVGVVTVNSMVTNNIKKWMLEVVSKAELAAAANTRDLCNVLSSRASLNHATGNLDFAVAYCKIALIAAESIADNDLDIANRLVNLANIQQNRFDYAASEPLLRRALALRRGVLGENHHDVAESLIMCCNRH